jgi:hypothetical protein
VVLPTSDGTTQIDPLPATTLDLDLISNPAFRLYPDWEFGRLSERDKPAVLRHTLADGKIVFLHPHLE